MDFIQQLQIWEKAELLQAKIMIGIGVVALFAFIGIFRSESELLRGMLIPLGLILVILIGYGGYILQSRPAHAKEAIALYQKDREEGIKKEIEKHETDNKAGNTLLKVYPIILLLSSLALIFVHSPYYKGMALGFALLAITTFIMDYGFVSRSNTVLEFLKSH